MYCRGEGRNGISIIVDGKFVPVFDSDRVKSRFVFLNNREK